MGFNLLANPFAVLGLPGAATIAAVTARSRELGGSEVSAASRALLAPRARLACELAFLPGASQAQVDGVLAALRNAAEPDLQPLTPLAKANVLAHLASIGRASPNKMRELVTIHDAAPLDVDAVLDRDRAAAKMPSAPRDALASALEALRTQHADALSEGAWARPDGGKLLVELLRAAGPEIRPRLSFLRHASAAWERAAASRVAGMLEAAEPLEARLRENAEPGSAAQLAEAIGSYAELVGPPREAARLLGLQHEPSAAAGERWWRLALDLGNRQSAVTEAATLLQALADGLGTEGELEQKVASDLGTCRKRLASGEGTPEMRRLAQALEAAHGATIVFRDFELAGMALPPATPALIRELHGAFLVAAAGARSDQPWQMLRLLCLRLHKEFSATNAALSFTVLALVQGRRNPVAASILEQLEVDRRFLRSALLSRELDVVVAAKKTSAIRRILAELITLTDDLKEKAEYEAALSRLRARARAPWMKLGAIAAIPVVIWLLNTLPSGSGRIASPVASHSASSQTAVQWSPPVMTPRSSSPAPAPVVSAASGPAPAYDRAERQPVPGAAVLSLAEHRWCTFRRVQADAAGSQIDELRAKYNDVQKLNAAIDAYNAYIQPLNASCSNYQYRKSDGAIVADELRSRASELKTEGINFVWNAYLSVAGSSSYSAVPSPTSSFDPAAAVPAASQAYLDGQTDRRAWETWFAGQGGDFRDGAEWWAGVRSKPRPPTCAAVPSGADRRAAVAGCNEAKSRLAALDRRRRADPDYRSGWNEP